MSNKINIGRIPLFIASTLVVSVAYLSFVSVTLGESQNYLYVDNFGVVQEVTADSTTEAMAKAVNKDENSGVMLVDSQFDMSLEGNYIPVDDYTPSDGSLDSVYLYIDIYGDDRTVIADSAEEAILTAVNRDSNSGVQELGTF